jgi:hypothetical protein
VKKSKEATMRRFLAYVSIMATFFFLAAVVALLFLAPEIDPMQSGISFYALTRYGSIINIALALAGLSGMSLAVTLWSTTLSAAGRIGLALLIAWGIASILAGAFPLDAPGAAPTLSGSIHNLAGLNFLLVVPAMLLIEITRSTLVPPTGRRPSTYWLTWLVLASAILLFIFNGPLSSLDIGGLVQRLYWLVLAVWLILKARQVLRTEMAASVP